jgi:hypothetical protein
MTLTQERALGQLVNSTGWLDQPTLIICIPNLSHDEYVTLRSLFRFVWTRDSRNDIQAVQNSLGTKDRKVIQESHGATGTRPER